jgi:hypothetical protein
LRVLDSQPAPPRFLGGKNAGSDTPQLVRYYLNQIQSCGAFRHLPPTEPPCGSPSRVRPWKSPNRVALFLLDLPFSATSRLSTCRPSADAKQKSRPFIGNSYLAFNDSPPQGWVHCMSRCSWPLRICRSSSGRRPRLRRTSVSMPACINMALSFCPLAPAFERTLGLISSGNNIDTLPGQIGRAHV